MRKFDPLDFRIKDERYVDRMTTHRKLIDKVYSDLFQKGYKVEKFLYHNLELDLIAFKDNQLYMIKTYSGLRYLTYKTIDKHLMKIYPYEDVLSNMTNVVSVIIMECGVNRRMLEYTKQLGIQVVTWNTISPETAKLLGIYAPNTYFNLFPPYPKQILEQTQST